MLKETLKIEKKHKKPIFIIDKNMRDYSKEPYFIKKTEEATAFLLKVGFPKDWEHLIIKK